MSKFLYHHVKKKHLSSFVLILFLSSCNKNSVNNENDVKSKYKSSITILNENYKIDTNVIINNLNKQKLLDGITAEKITEKKTTLEIPGFILDFLNKTSANGKFEMAGKGGPWNDNKDGLGQLVPTKVYDEFSKDSITVLVTTNSTLPNKQMVYFGIGKKYALLSYFNSSSGSSQHASIIQFENEKIIDFWFTMNPKLGQTKNGLIHSIKNSQTRMGGC